MQLVDKLTVYTLHYSHYNASKPAEMERHLILPYLALLSEQTGVSCPVLKLYHGAAHQITQK